MGRTKSRALRDVARVLSAAAHSLQIDPVTQSGWGFALVGFGLVLGASCGGESHGETEEPDWSHPELCLVNL